MPALYKVRIKSGCTHGVAPEVHRAPLHYALAGEIIQVTQAEIDAFGDKFDVLTDVVVKIVEDSEDASLAYEATVSAQALATKNGIDLAGVIGTGKDGRIIRADVERAIKVQAG